MKHFIRISTAILTIFFLKTISAQPLKNAEELVFEYKGIHTNCSYKKLKKCFEKTKVSASIISGSIGKLQGSVVFKLSGMKSTLGGQAWYMLNKMKNHSIWIGGELNSDSQLKIGKEAFFSYEYTKGFHSFLPFFSLILDKEHIGSYGVKYHFLKLFSLGLESYRLQNKKWTYSLMFGVPLNQDAFSDILKIFE